MYSALKIPAVALEVVSFMRYNQQIVKGLLTILIGSGEPHAQESVGKAVDFCSALVIVGE